MTKVLLIFSSLLLTVVTCEFGLRVYDRFLDWQYPKEEKDRSVFFEYDPLLGWKLAPNKLAYFASKQSQFRTLVKTNSRGLRDHNYQYKKEKGVKRVLLLGDSVTAGFEVRSTEMIATRLRHYLSRHGRYHVIDAGVRGYGTDQLYLWLKHEGYKYEPDVVIYIFYVNDPMNNITIHNHSAQFGKPYFTLTEKDELVLNGVPVPRTFDPPDKHLTSDKKHQHIYDARLEKQLGESKEKKEGFLRQFQIGRLLVNALDALEVNRFMRHLPDRRKNPTAVEQVTPQDQGPEEYRWRITGAIIRDMNKLSNDIGAKFLVYESTDGTADPARVSQTPLGRLCKDLDVNYFESFKEFYEVSHGEAVLRFDKDIHWNARGHDMAAKVLYEYLRSNAWF
jgi:lysophospholipase L1-like esterase